MKTVKGFGLLLSILIIGLMSCQRNSQTEENTHQVDSLSADSIISEQALTLPFQAIYNERTDRFEMIKNLDSTHTAFTADGLAKALNDNYPEIRVVIDRKSNDTLMVSIPNAPAITQQKQKRA